MAAMTLGNERYSSGSSKFQQVVALPRAHKEWENNSNFIHGPVISELDFDKVHHNTTG